MQRPTCGLCRRIGARCAFPLRQKPPPQATRSQSMKRTSRKPSSGTRSFSLASETSPAGHSTTCRFHPPGAKQVPESSLRVSPSDQSDSISIESLLLPQEVISPVEVGDLSASRLWPQDHSSAEQPWLVQSSSMTVEPQNLLGGEIVDGTDWTVGSVAGAEMLELFFDKTQSWLTFMHRPSFILKFVRQTESSSVIVDRLTVSQDEAFVVYCMFAIAARFSRSNELEHVPVLDRGDRFATLAVTMKDSRMKSMREPTVDFLKGCVILAYYYLVAGDLGPGSILTSICVRFAFDLSLDVIDEDQINAEGSLVKELPEDSPDVWLGKEERRRLWWSVWELDTFVSSLALQPYGIQRGEMKVLLPAPDHNWLSGIPIRSAFINHRPESVWKTLQGSPNQCARAWFLLVNYLKSCIAWATWQPGRLSTSTKQSLDAALCNLKLSLPADFHLGSVFLDSRNYEEGNWVIAMHLMIIAADTFLERSTWAQHKADKTDSTTQQTVPNPSPATPLFSKRLTAYLVQIGQVWTPNFIHLCHPIICCAAILPASTDARQSESAQRADQVAKIILAHYAKYWKLASEMLHLLSIVEQGLCSAPPEARTEEQNVLLKQYSALLPSMSRRRGPASALPESGRGINHQSPCLDLFINGSELQLQQSLGIWPDFESFDIESTTEAF